jgi:hypothetical protein
VSGQQLRCHHPHRRAVLTAGQALRAESLQRLLRSGGRIGFYSIIESPAARRRVWAAGPRAWPCAATTNGCSLPPVPRHQRARRHPAFAATGAAWLADSEPYAEEFARLEPPGAFAQRQADRTACWPPSTPGCCAAPSSSPEQEQGRRRREVCTTQSLRRWRNRLHDRQPTATAQTVVR